MTISGVYFIRNTLSDKVYVGSSSNIYRRWTTHKRELKAGRHHSILLQRSFDKHGEAAFEYCLAESADCAKQMRLLETKWIKLLNAVQNGYNVNPFPYEIGLMPKSEEHKRKIGQAHIGRKLSEESKEKIRQKALGRKYGPMSEERKQHLSKVKMGWKMPEEGKQKLSEYRTGLKLGTMSESQRMAISKGILASKFKKLES